MGFEIATLNPLTLISTSWSVLGVCVEAGCILDGVAQLPAVARHLVAEELLGQRPVVGVAAEALEVPVGDGA